MICKIRRGEVEHCGRKKDPRRCYNLGKPWEPQRGWNLWRVVPCPHSGIGAVHHPPQRVLLGISISSNASTTQGSLHEDWLWLPSHPWWMEGSRVARWARARAAREIRIWLPPRPRWTRKHVRRARARARGVWWADARGARVQTPPHTRSITRSIGR